MAAVESPPFPFNDTACGNVALALAEAIREQDRSAAKLRQAIAGCTRSLRSLGMLPEAVLITMKAFVKHTAVAHPLSGPDAAWWVADAWMDDIVKWCIVEYFRDE